MAGLDLTLEAGRRRLGGPTAKEVVSMPTAVEDIMESVATGVLRALDARSEGARGRGSADQLVRSGFNVSIVIRAGGISPLDLVALNPQPLPPRALEQEGGFAE
jgi:hypothetical protein